MESKGNVRRIIKFSAVDGPGNRSAVFLQGCNFNCVYCHNPETIAKNDEEAKEMTVSEVFSEIGSAVKYIRGITISGGECMLQRNFVLALCKEAKGRGLSAFLDSNGFYDFAADKELLEFTDAVMLDVKSSDLDEHKKITGLSNEQVLTNLKFLANSRKLYEVRTVISPQLFDCAKTVEYVSEIISAYEDIRYKLIKYRPMGVRKEYLNYKVPTAGFMEDMKLLAQLKGAKNIIVV